MRCVTAGESSSDRARGAVPVVVRELLERGDVARREEGDVIAPHVVRCREDDLLHQVGRARVVEQRRAGVARGAHHSQQRVGDDRDSP